MKTPPIQLEVLLKEAGRVRPGVVGPNSMDAKPVRSYVRIDDGHRQGIHRLIPLEDKNSQGTGRTSAQNDRAPCAEGLRERMPQEAHGQPKADRESERQKSID